MPGACVVALGRFVPARAGDASSDGFSGRQREVTPAADRSRQGWQGRWVARVAGRQNVATSGSAVSRVAEKMMGSLFESKNHHSHHSGIARHSDNWIPSLLYRKHWSQIYVECGL